MNQWPNLEVQIKPAKKKPGKSLYARVTDTGIDLKKAANRLNIDWDTAAEIDDADVKDESDVPSVVVKFTIAIEDMREVERRKLVGIKDPDGPTREQLAGVLEEVPSLLLSSRILS